MQGIAQEDKMVRHPGPNRANEQADKATDPNKHGK
jgi:hypothetical protein